MITVVLEASQIALRPLEPAPAAASSTAQVVQVSTTGHRPNFADSGCVFEKPAQELQLDIYKPFTLHAEPEEPSSWTAH